MPTPRRHSLVRIALPALTCMLLSACTAHPGIETRFDHFDLWYDPLQPDAEWLSPEAISVRFEHDFGRYFEGDVLQRLDTGDLKLLFRATHMTALKSPSPTLTSQLGRIVSTLESRDALQAWQVAYWQQGLLAARQFSEARALRLAHPDVVMPDVPDFTDLASGNAPSVLSLSNDAQTVTRTDAALPGSGLVVVFSPGCGFSRRAFAALEKQTSLAELLQTRTVWLHPASGDLDIPAWAAWNRNNPHAPLVEAHAETEWSWIDSWATPTFYVLRNGQVHTKVVGWPGEEQLDVLTHALHSADLVGP